MRLRLAIPWLLLAAVSRAQTETPPTPVVLENNGHPMRLAIECSLQDIRAAGLTCPTGHPCSVYLELASAEEVGSRVFATGNLHTEAATLFSVLLASDNGGRTWREPYERVRGAGLDKIQFIDFENGWVSGQTLGLVPRDPFLLLTRDGGKTWVNRPVFGESRAGSIDSFHFDSPSHGMLWIDRSLSGETEGRYELYESSNGGETWVLLKASNQPFKAEPRTVPAGDVRLRADRGTHSFRIERRGAGQWQPVASFLVRAGECREPEVILPPEEQPPQDAPGEAPR
jgi:photosystem II stability/assembly factor-like uncharacterized protein